MCTVSLVYNPEIQKNFILTSNRDEAVSRRTTPPNVYDEKGIKMLYPKDLVGGGSWIGISENKRLICLLNGAFTTHNRQPPYRKSRGIVLKEFLEAGSFEDAVKNYDFQDIEPFTLIVVEWKYHLRFMELVWDGAQRHYRVLELKDHLWSSSPLYDNSMKQEREKWFRNFQENADGSSQSIWDFHHTGGVGVKNIDIIMDRGFIKTQSITQVVKSNKEIKMIYEDLENKEITESIFPGG